MALAKESSRQYDPFKVPDPFPLFYALTLLFQSRFRSSLKWLVALVEKLEGNPIDDLNIVASIENPHVLTTRVSPNEKKRSATSQFENPAANRSPSRHRRPSLERRDLLPRFEATLRRRRQRRASSSHSSAVSTRFLRRLRRRRDARYRRRSRSTRSSRRGKPTMILSR